MSTEKNEKARAAYARNPEIFMARSRLWRTKNPDRVNAYNRAWYRKNRAKRLDSCKKYREKNREKMNAVARERTKAKYHNDEAYRKKDNARTALWRRNNPEKTKSILLKSEYGLSASDLEAMKREQDERCVICLKVTKLTVDHDHSNGKIRGLLCGNCNRGLGCFSDNPTFLRNAASYLESIQTRLP